jgi:hypothetical protein
MIMARKAMAPNLRMTLHSNFDIGGNNDWGGKMFLTRTGAEASLDPKESFAAETFSLSTGICPLLVQ